MALFTTAIGGLLLQKSERLNISATIQQFQAERLQAMQLLNAISEGSDDAIFAKDPEGRYLLCNQATVRFVGKPADEILGRDDTAIFPADQAAMLIATNRRVREENCIVRCEEHLDLPDGPRVFLTTKGPLHDEQGKPMGTFGIARDITARKQAEDDLISQTAELRRQNEELQRFNRASVGRELAMVDLKREINELCRQLGREPPYDPAALERMFVGSRDSANE
jgi:PAS domain S-box-containing protein